MMSVDGAVRWVVQAGIVLVVSLASGVVSAAPSDCSCSREWVQTFRGNQHRSFYGTGYIPAKLKVRWRFRTRWIRDSRLKGYGGRKLIWRGTGWSGQAAVVGDRVWVSSVGGILYCLNRHTGKQIWSYNAGLSIKSSVTYWNGRVYFGSRSNRLYCLDARTGKKLWTYRTPGRNVDSTPLIWKGRMYWGSEDTHLYAMNPINGKVFWKYKTMGSIESSPMIHGDKIYINSFDGHLHCLDLKTGKRHWRFRTGDDTDTTPTFHRGKIYFGSENGKVYAVRAQTGELLWERQNNGGVWSTPALAGNRLFYGSNGRRIHGLDTRTGRQLWKYKTGDGVWASPVYVNGRLLVGDWAGYVHVLRARDGERLHRMRIGVEFAKDGNHIVSTASVVKGRVYLGSRDGHFYCFEGPKVTSKRQRRVMSRWRQRYGEDRSIVVREPGTLPPLSQSALSGLSGVISEASLRSRFGVALTSRKLYPRLLVARLLRRKGWPKATALALLKLVLRDSADHVRLEGLRAAARYGQAGAALVVGLLKDRDGRNRAAACRLLGQFGSKRDITAIEALLWDHDARVQASCGKALLLLGQGRKATAMLKRFLFGGSRGRWRGKRRRGRVRARRYGCPNRVSKYYLYRTKEGKIRRSPRDKMGILTALIALHKAGDRCASKHLFSRWYSCSGDREKGFCTIYSDWQGWMQRNLPLWIVPLAPVKRQLRLLKRYALPRYKDKNQRANGIRHLMTLKTPKRVPVMLRMLKREKYALLRVLSALGLGRTRDIQDTRLVTKIRKQLSRTLAKDKYPDVRMAAARGLLQRFGGAAKPLIAAQLKRERFARNRAGMAALLVLAGESSARRFLKQAMSSPSMQARCRAMRGLVAYTAGLSLVRRQLQSKEPFLRLCAIRALVGMKRGQGRKDALTSASQHTDPAVFLRAATARIRR